LPIEFDAAVARFIDGSGSCLREGRALNVGKNEAQRPTKN
jgi:hypothetical protein